MDDPLFDDPWINETLTAQAAHADLKRRKADRIIRECPSLAARVEEREREAVSRYARLAQEIEPESERPGERAKEFLQTLLGHGPKATREVEAAAIEADHSMSTLRRAARDLHIVKYRKGGQHHWRLNRGAPSVKGLASLASLTT